MTRREEIIEILKKEKISVQEIANLYRVIISEVLIDFYHIKKTFNNKLKKEPAVCSYCGFVFEERSRIKTPSKCPKCKHEKIFPQRFWIEG